MAKITLYHGSLDEMIPDNNRWGIYLTRLMDIANGYIVAQADGAAGSYGHIYSVEIDEERLSFTDDIDQLQKYHGSVLYCIDDEYYRIDDPESYEWKELSAEEILL